MPKDWASGLWADHPALSASEGVRRTQEPQALSPELPQRWDLLRGRHQSHARRPGRGHEASVDAGDHRVEGPRWHPQSHYGYFGAGAGGVGAGLSPAPFVLAP